MPVLWANHRFLSDRRSIDKQAATQDSEGGGRLPAFLEGARFYDPSCSRRVCKDPADNRLSTLLPFCQVCRALH
jgi:hypothetical protein